MPWQLIWSDEFNGAVLDTTKWDSQLWYGRTHGAELQYYTDEDVIVTGGICRLRMQKRDYVVDEVVWHYTSGIIATHAHFAHLFGKVEIRCRMPVGCNGLLPQIWLLSAPYPPYLWPPEIDIMEHLSHVDGFYINYHWKVGGVNYQTDLPLQPSLTLDQWHVFTMEWSPNLIVWYYDNVQVASWTIGINNLDPMCLQIGMCVEDVWGNPPDANTPSPSYFDIDYVRIYAASGAG